MIYLDSSALLKLLFEEPESQALTEWLAVHTDDSMVSSDLAEIEVMRTCRRINAHVVPRASRLLAGLDLARVSQPIVEQAVLVGPATVRSLDAIHLGTALTLGSAINYFVTYDHRLQQSALAEGLRVISPPRAMNLP